MREGRAGGGGRTSKSVDSGEPPLWNFGTREHVCRELGGPKVNNLRNRSSSHSLGHFPPH